VHKKKWFRIQSQTFKPFLTMECQLLLYSVVLVASLGSLLTFSLHRIMQQSPDRLSWGNSL